MFTNATLPIFESAPTFSDHARDVVRAHVRPVGTGAGHLAARVRTTAKQLADRARTYAARLATAAERLVGARIKRRVQPPIAAVVVVAGAALALAIIAVVVPRR